MKKRINILLRLIYIGIWCQKIRPPYEFKTALFDNGGPEEFLLFVRNFNMNIEASVKLKANANILYPRKLVSGEALRRFHSLSAELESASPENLSSIILGLGTYFFLIMICPWKSAQWSA